jgi:cysteine synthase
MQGWSPDFIPKITGDAVDMGIIDELLTIAGPDAIRCSQDLATKEGIFVGISSGATLAGAATWAPANPLPLPPKWPSPSKPSTTMKSIPLRSSCP